MITYRNRLKNNSRGAYIIYIYIFIYVQRRTTENFK